MLPAVIFFTFGQMLGVGMGTAVVAMATPYGVLGRAQAPMQGTYTATVTVSTRSHAAGTLVDMAGHTSQTW